MMNEQFRIPGRLTAKNALETLNKLGIDVTVVQAMVDSNDGEIPPMRFGYENRPSVHAIDVKKVDAALAKTSVPASEKIRYKYALSRLGLLK